MKNTIKHIGLISFACLMTLAGCDKIANDEYTVYAGTTGTWTDGTTAPEAVQRAFVEKYTGPRCNNCPSADVTLDAAHDQFGDQLVTVAVNHASGQGEPYNNQPDLRCEDGNTWDNYFGFTSIPSALLNRNTDKIYAGAMTDITADISTAVSESPVVTLDVEATAQGEKIDIKVTVQYVQAYADPTTLTLALIEDSLVYWQLTNDNTLPSGLDQNYAHNHMLRDVITDVWGTDIDATGTTGEIRTATFSYTTFSNLNPAPVLDNCHIVAFVSDKATKRILNAAQTSL